MDDSIPGFMAYIKHLFSEHRRLETRVETIRGDLASLSSGLASEADRRDLVLDLQKLHDELAIHFNEEQEGGCLEEAVSRNPNVTEEAARLEGEHEVLLGRLRELMGKVEGAAATPEADADVAAAFDSFAEELLAHEVAENRIMERGFNIDLELENR
jgi:hypothetical protein